jgi:hypothetical protein
MTIEKTAVSIKIPIPIKKFFITITSSYIFVFKEEKVSYPSIYVHKMNIKH